MAFRDGLEPPTCSLGPKAAVAALSLSYRNVKLLRTKIANRMRNFTLCHPTELSPEPSAPGEGTS